MYCIYETLDHIPSSCIIGASLSEPHINGYELCECDIYIWYVDWSLVTPRPTSIIPYIICCSNSTTCKFTFMWAIAMNEARARQSSSSIGALAKQNLLATESAEEKEARLRACILQPIVYSWAWRNINHCYTLTVAQACPTMLCISLVITVHVVKGHQYSAHIAIAEMESETDSQPRK